MKTINIKKGIITVVDDEDYDRIISLKNQLNARFDLMYEDKMLYAVMKYKFPQVRTEEVVFLHNIVMGVTHPSIKYIHINSEGLDNRKENIEMSFLLRTKKSKYSRFKGVSFNINKKNKHYTATLYNPKTRKLMSLGCFKTELEAAIAYNEGSRKLFGAKAFQNKLN